MKVFIVKETHFCMVKWACMSHITSRVMTRQMFSMPMTNGKLFNDVWEIYCA